VFFVDTNVFAIEKCYRRDPHFRVNHRFLEALRKKGGGATTPVNLLEFAGILSFSLNPAQLAAAGLEDGQGLLLTSMEGRCGADAATPPISPDEEGRDPR
jgi:predicted nucleic acid-binding protein